jgi:hypothetical protein
MRIKRILTFFLTISLALVIISLLFLVKNYAPQEKNRPSDVLFFMEKKKNTDDYLPPHSNRITKIIDNEIKKEDNHSTKKKDRFIDFKSLLDSATFYEEDMFREKTYTYPINFENNLGFKYIRNNNSTRFEKILIVDEMNSEFIFHSGNDYVNRFFSNYKRNIYPISSPNSLLEIRTNTIEHENENNFDHINPLDSSILSIDLENFRPFYILDVFNTLDSCSHGDKVYDVVVQLLSKYGFNSKILEKIKKFPINYFNNIDYGKAIIEYYNSLFEQVDVSQSNRKLFPPSDSIESVYKNNFRYTSPNYLTAIINFCEKDEPDIISNSYSLLTPSKSIPPAWTFTYQTNESSNTNYIASGTNDSEAIEKYRKATEYGYTEPYFSFIRSADQFGIIFVGNKSDTGKFSGMFSNDGKLMHVLGKGSKWGNDKTCIQQKDNGTSFATPEVATKLFIAKAYWRSKGLNIDPIEARNRIILATDLEAPFINKFSSAGSVSIEKLLQIDSAYLVTVKDSLIGINSIIDANISFSETGIGYREFNTSLSEAVKGLYLKEDMWFAIFNNENKWKLIAEPVNFSIAYVDKNSQTQFVSKKKFKESFKQFVILNKTK